MSAPWGDERPPVSRLLYRLPPFLSPPPALPRFLPLPRSFSLSPSLAWAFSNLFYILSLLKNFSVQTHRIVYAHTFTHSQGRSEPSCSKPEAEVFIQMNVYFSRCQDVRICLRLCMCLQEKERENSLDWECVCVSVCVTYTAEGEGLTVGDKPGRPAHCDYNTPDALSHTCSLLHTCIHNGQRGSVLQGFRIDGRRDRRADREGLDHRQGGSHNSSKWTQTGKHNASLYVWRNSHCVYLGLISMLMRCDVETQGSKSVFSPETIRLCHRDMTSVRRFNLLPSLFIYFFCSLWFRCVAFWGGDGALLSAETTHFQVSFFCLLPTFWVSTV